MSLSSAAASCTVSSPLLATHNNLNRKWILKRRPVGIFDPQLDAELVVTNNDDEATATKIEDHQVLIEPQLLSVDAFLRTIMDEGDAYHGNLELGSALPALGYGKVLAAGPKSGHKVGTTVTGMMTASDTSVVNGKRLFKLTKFPFLPKSASLGLLGMTSGLTAYCGVFYVCKPPRKGETAVITGAAGAVGSIAVQLCKSRGAKVVGVAGGKLKGDYLKDELGCDAVIDYKDTSRPLKEQIAEACPDGIDFVYDNVGGDILNELLAQINRQARVVICGAISQYSGNLGTQTVQGPSNYLKLAEMGAEMKGFAVLQYFAKLPFMILGMLWLYVRGKVTMTEHVEEGLENFPHALQKLFTGQTIGKTLVRIKSDEDSL